MKIFVKKILRKLSGKHADSELYLKTLYKEESNAEQISTTAEKQGFLQRRPV
jgi:mRNA-degrading endonuclease HigB of HigAB toxin-antitoxin module